MLKKLLLDCFLRLANAGLRRGSMILLLYPGSFKLQSGGKTESPQEHRQILWLGGVSATLLQREWQRAYILDNKRNIR